ncbi:hypothetical protein [Roseibium sp. Sym1]|uniref:hypothetical protein n=1 Tax=Roseibium sp. Sym1 TaxID=3016006 RepID=UPI0022B4E078|nr:hypothetical protein [Roseibium sp. Sym1]
MIIPRWARTRLDFDRMCRTDFESDEYIVDVRHVFGQALPDGVASIIEVSTTASSVEVLFERLSERAVLLWDTDFTNRLDGLLALIFCDEQDGDASVHQALGLAAYSNLAASIFLKKDPAVAQFILRLTDEFMPESLSVTVDDDHRMDRYRRLIRVYVALHELAHILYRVLPEMIPEIDERIRSTIANIHPSHSDKRKRELTPVDQELQEKGLLVKDHELGDVVAQIRRHLQRPNDYEEIWCDVFASEHLLGWADEHGYKAEECVVADDLLHLMLAGRMQWFCFWDRSVKIQDWRQSGRLSNHENRANIRGLLMAANAAQSWGANQSGPEPHEVSSAFAALVSAEGDTLKKRFVDRNHFSLGLLGGLDREEMFERANLGWSRLSVAGQDSAIGEMLTSLS